MELLTRNAVVRAKHTEVDGVRYVIAPMTLIVPGVLAGSQGALYYPASEIAKNYRQWEGVPVVVNHPTDPLTGINQSAYDDGVQERSGVGVLKNVRIGRGGKLQADGWIDVAKAAQVDPVIIGNILNGVPVELSTGLFTTNLPAEPGAACPRTGRAYQAIATDYRPDHLAVLSNGVPGACSLKDGCGVLVNKAFPTSPRVSPTTPTYSQAETSVPPPHTSSSPQGDRVGVHVGDHPSLNVFCATGVGGGVDPSCKKGESRQADPPEPGSSQAKRTSDRAHELTSRLRVREHRLAAAIDSSAAAVQTSAQAAYARDPELHNRTAWHHSGAYDALVEAAPHYARHPAESQALEEAAQAHIEAARYHRGARDELQHGGRDGHNRAVQRQREQAAEASQAALRETMAAPAETNYAHDARRLAEEAAVASDRAYDEKDPTAAYEAHRAAYKAHDLAREAHYLTTGQMASDRESWEAHRRAMQAHNTAADAHGETWQALRRLAYLGHVANVFCKTGKDGGVDPTCKKDGSASGKGGVKTDPDKKPTPAADTSPRKPRTESAESALAGTLSDKGYDVLRPLNTKRDVRELARQAQAAARKASSATNPEAARAYHLSAADYHNKVMSKLVFKSLFGKKSDAAWVVHSQARQAHLKAAVASGPSKAVAEQALQQRQLAQELTLAAQAPSKRAGGRASASADQAAILAGRALYEVDSGEAASLHARAAGAHRTAAADHTTRGNQAHSEEEKKEHAEAAKLHTQARETHTTAAYQLRALKKQGHVTNVFCATGKGGGVDPTCKRGESRQSPPDEDRRAALRGVNQAVDRAYRLLPANMRRSVDGETLLRVLEMAGRAEERGDAKALDGLYTRLHEVSRRLFDGYRRLPNTPTGGPDSEDPAYALVEASMMAQGARAELRQGRGHTHRLVSDLRDAASSSSLRAMEATQASGLEPSHPVYQQAARAAILSDAALEERQIEPAIRAHRDAAGEHQVAASDLHQLSYAAHDRGDSDSAARLAQAAQRHDAAFRRHENAVEELEQAAKLGHTTNVFCTTGTGGGVDPSCKKGESRQAPPDLPGTAAVLKRSREAWQIAEETATRTPALEVAFARAHEAVRLAEAADKAATAEETAQLHEDARQAHQNASRLFYQQGQAQAGDWQRWSASAHRQAAREAEQGRGVVMRDVRRQREFAQEASQRALAAGRGLGGGPVTEREQEAAVRSDMAFDEEDPVRATELHRQAGHLHEQVAYSRWRDARRAADEGETIEERLRRSYEAHDLAREAHAEAAAELERLIDTGHVSNVFCPTGQGGGVDPSCKRGEGRQAPPDKSEYAVARASSAARESRTAAGAAMSSGYQAVGTYADRARAHAREAERLTEAGDLEGAKRAHLEAGEAHDEVVRTIGFTHNPPLREVARLNHDAGAQHREIVLELEKGIGAAERELQEDRDVAAHRTAHALERSRAIPPGFDNSARAIAEEAAVASDEATDEREINRAVELHRRAAELHRRAVVAHQGPVIDNDEYNHLHDRAASTHAAAAEWHEAASRNLARAARRGHTLNTFQREPSANAFCSTGEGGGVDPSCGKNREGGLKQKAKQATRAAFKALTFSPESTSKVASRAAEEAAAGTRAGYVQAVYHHLQAAQKFGNPPGDWLADDADREKYAKLAERHRQAAEHYKRKVLAHNRADNVFCATGEGGGVDPSCKRGESRQAPPEHQRGVAAATHAVSRLLDLLPDDSPGRTKLASGMARAATAKTNEETRRAYGMALDGGSDVLTSLSRGHFRGGEHDRVNAALTHVLETLEDARNEVEFGKGRSHRELRQRRDVAAQATARARQADANLHLSQDNPTRRAAETAAVLGDKAYDAEEIHEAIELHDQVAGEHEIASRRYWDAGERAYNRGERDVSERLMTASERHRIAGRRHAEAADALIRARDRGHTTNVFCATGEGGGVDPSCKKGEFRQAPPEDSRGVSKTAAQRSRELRRQTDGLPGAARAKRVAAAASEMARRAEAADSDAEAANLHDQAGSLHVRAREILDSTSGQRGGTVSQGHNTAATLHWHAAYELRHGREAAAQRARRARSEAYTATQTALQQSRDNPAAQEAAVASDQAQDQIDPREAARFHQTAERYHRQAAGELSGQAATAHHQAATAHLIAAHLLRPLADAGHVTNSFRCQPNANAFCNTGKGGGVDPSCGKGGGAKAAAPAAGRGGARQAEPPAHHGSTLAADASGKATWATQRSANSQAKDLARTAGQHALLAAEHARAGRTNDAVAHHQTASNTHQAVVGALRRRHVLGEEDMHKAHAQAALAHDAAASELRQGRGALANDVRKHRDAAGAATARAFEASNKSGGKYDRRPIEDAAVLSDQASDERHPETAARLHHQAGAAHGVAAEVHAKAGHREAAAAHRAASEEHRTVARRLHGLHMTGHVANVFCATGEGGGVDPSCKRGGSSQARGEAKREAPPDHPRTASIEASKHSQTAYEATHALPAARRAKTHASGARAAAQRAANAGNTEDAANNHLNAAGHHDKAAFALELVRDGGTAARAHREAASSHRTAAGELRLGRNELAKQVSGYRAHAGTSSTHALERSQAAGGPAVGLAEEAAVASDMAQEEKDINRAADLHRDAAVLHSRAADAHQQAPAGEHDKEDRLQSEAMWAHRRAYTNHLETAESLRQLARIGHTTNAHKTLNPEAA